MMKKYFFLLFILVTTSGYGQADSLSKELAIADFFSLIQQYHPVAKQASLLSDQAKARLRSARGGFDPKAYADVNQKRFGDKEYYHLSEYGLKVPTWFGIEAKAAYEWNSGNYLNPEHNVPNEGLGVIGISMPIGQGLFIDDRRAQLKQAKIFQEANEAERVIMMNDLLLDAAKTYWNWAMAFENYKLVEEALDLARMRYKGVVESFMQGDKPAIDTLESYILVQDREVMLIDARVELQNSQLLVSNFLWFDNGVPLELEQNVEPSGLNDLMYQTQLPEAIEDSVLKNIAMNTPWVTQYQLKVNTLNVERRLKIEKVKPKINLNYNLLTTGTDFPSGSTVPSPYYLENYKFGISASMPLFLREGRGGIGEANVKLKQASLALELKRLETINKIRAYQNELIGLNEQIVIYQQTVKNYERMLLGEQTKFENGESSIFLINSREVKLMNAQSKLISLKTKYKKTLASLSWSMGSLPTN